MELSQGGIHCKGVRWGELPFSNEYRKRFLNLRAQSTVHAIEAIKDGAIRFTNKYKKDLLDQASRMPYHLDELGRYHIARKQDMASENLPSPDFFDTVCMVFLEGVDYVPAKAESESLVVDKREQALEQAAEELADLE